MANKNGTPKAGPPPEDWADRWLQTFAEYGTVSYACQVAEVGRTTVYARRQRDESFAIAWADVEERTTERMEQEAIRRGTDGVDRNVYHQGEVVGQERHYSDTLLMFMLKSRRPERYRDNVKLEHAGTVRHDIDVTVEVPDTIEYRRQVALVAAQALGLPSSTNGSGNGHS